MVAIKSFILVTLLSALTTYAAPLAQYDDGEIDISGEPLTLGPSSVTPTIPFGDDDEAAVPVPLSVSPSPIPKPTVAAPVGTPKPSPVASPIASPTPTEDSDDEGFEGFGGFWPWFWGKH